MSIQTTPAPALDAILGCRPAFPGEVQAPEDERSAREEWERKFGERRRPIRDARDLLIHIGDALAAIGLEPDVRAGALDFLFLGARHRLSLLDLDRDVEETLRGQGDRDLMAAGLPVG